MPVLMWLQRLNKAGTLLGFLAVPAPQQIGFAQHTVNAAGTDGNHILIQHHEGQSAITFQRMIKMKLNNGLFLPVIQPEIAGNQAIVLIGPAITLPPAVILAGTEFKPLYKMRHRNVGTIGLISGEIYHCIANIMGNPRRLSGNPKSCI